MDRRAKALDLDQSTPVKQAPAKGGKDMLAALSTLLPDCKIEEAHTPDQYGAALQVTYESVLGKDENVDGYISRAALIETGARLAREPADTRNVVPYGPAASPHRLKLSSTRLFTPVNDRCMESSEA